MKEIKRANIKKILILRYRFIGDTGVTVPFLYELRSIFPEAEITIVLAPFSGQVLKHCPYIDKIIYYDPPTIHKESKGAHKGIINKIRFIKELRAAEYDMVFVLKRSLSSAIIAYLTGAKYRIGFDTEMRGFLLTHKVKYSRKIHEAMNFLNCLKFFKEITEIKEYKLWVTEAEQMDIKEILKKENIPLDKKIFVIHAFSAHKYRQWPRENFLYICDYLVEKGFTVIFVGAASDGEIERKGCYSLIGKLSLRQTMALLSIAYAFLGNDSGIMHLAAGFDIYVIALFGPSSYIHFGPLSNKSFIITGKKLECQPCYNKFPCRKEKNLAECMLSIDRGTVLDILTKII